MMTQAAALPMPSSKFEGKRVHFIGIGGSGMSGLAKMLLDAGAIVSGSEPKPNPTSLALQNLGAKVSGQQDGMLLERDVHLVVRTAAVPDTNPEYQRAVGLGLRVVKYAELLGEVMAERQGVAVAGTHGKSTTTAMTAFALTRLGADPSWVVGGTVPQLGGGSHSGGGEMFVAEACEYDRSFHNLKPTIAIITNVDADHLDVYGSLAGIEESFRHFARLVPATGRIITLAGSDSVRRSLEGVAAPIDYVGFSGCNLPMPRSGDRLWTVEPLADEGSFPRAMVTAPGGATFELKLSVPGRHNLMNATMAVAAAHAGTGLAPALLAQALQPFSGVDRRMTLVGTTAGGATVVDDYGHHPTEVEATLGALRQRYQPTKLTIIFQPHQASRTRMLFEQFVDALSQADEVYLPEVYYTRDSEEDRRTVTSRTLVERLRQRGVAAHFVTDLKALAGELRQSGSKGQLILTMGAGNIGELARELPGDAVSGGVAVANVNVGAGPFSAKEFEGLVRTEVPLAGKTWYGIGGNARYFAQPGSVEELSTLYRTAKGAGVPVFVLGRGANVLVGDAGVDGLVISLDQKAFVTANWREDGVTLGAGFDLLRLPKLSGDRGLWGVEFMAGIPGTVGGAVRMNAGGRYGDFGSAVKSVTVLDVDGKVQTRGAESFTFAYRQCSLTDPVILGADLRLTPGNPEAVTARVKELWDAKQKSQPLQAHSAGCVFKNPDSAVSGGLSAGALIDQAGLKGTRFGGAEVSRIHANFIVADKGCRASDVLHLIEQTRGVVLARFGVMLESEVKIWANRGG
jgi:UDP-N-acetylmuramate--alanine ligase